MRKTGHLDLVTKNNNGVFQDSKNAKGKVISELAWENCQIVNSYTGKIISDDVRPQFEGIMYDDYLASGVKFLEPMSAHEDKDFIETTHVGYENYIAELKRDGHRATVHIYDNFNRVFSRRPSKTSGGWLNENSDCVPHIRDLQLPSLYGTVLDGEFDYGETSKEVQSVMGSLPQNAIQHQFNNDWITFYAFDILYYKGINVQAMPLWKRKVYLLKALLEIWSKYKNCNIEFQEMLMTARMANKFGKLVQNYDRDYNVNNQMELHTIVVNNYKEKYEELVEQGHEGVMLKDIFGKYEQKKSKNMVKIKKFSTWDVIIMGLTEPTKVYTGKEIEDWTYWEQHGELVEGWLYNEYISGNGLTPVTKPYFFGWCGAIKFGVLKPFSQDDYDTPYIDQAIDDGSAVVVDDELYWIREVGDCKGLSEEVLEDLKNNIEDYVREKRVLEVKAQEIIDKSKGSLRHPRFVKWRDDKHWKQCDWNSHIREVE